MTKRKVDRKAAFLSRMLNRSFFLDRKNKNPIIYGVAFRKVSQIEAILLSQSFSTRDVRSKLGGSHADYKQFLRPFWIFDEGNEGYSKVEKTTKAYLLNDRTLTTLYDTWRGNAAAEIVDEDTGRRLTGADFPKNGVCRAFKSTIHIAAIIPISLQQIDALIANEEAKHGDMKGSKLPLHLRRRRVQALRYLFEGRHWIRSLGGVPNLYADHFEDNPKEGKGRLWGIGGFHLQRLRKTARGLLYAGTGWWDFDFRACHWSILHSLARGYGLETPALDYYIDTREETNELIAEDVDIPTWQMKRVMNSTIYGQPLTKSPHSSLMATIGATAIDKLMEQDFYLWLRDEIKTVIRPEIVARHTQGEIVINTVGKEFPLWKENKDGSGKKIKVPDRKALSHILTGYERWALNLVCSNRKDLIALMHDGWVSKEARDTKALENSIHQEATRAFGLQLNLTIKAFQHI